MTMNSANFPYAPAELQERVLITIFGEPSQLACSLKYLRRYFRQKNILSEYSIFRTISSSSSNFKKYTSTIELGSF